MTPTTLQPQKVLVVVSSMFRKNTLYLTKNSNSNKRNSSPVIGSSGGTYTFVLKQRLRR